MRWLRRLIRKYTKPMHELDAIKWKQRMAVLYAFVAWNAFGLVAYQMYNNKHDWAHYYGLKLDEQAEKRPGVYYAELFGAKNAKIYRINGFTITDEVDFKAPEKETKA